MTQTAAACPACGSGQTRMHAMRCTCAACGSVWVPARQTFEYGDDYPAERGHHEASVALSKQRTLAAWLKTTGIGIDGRQVLEVGFGGGATLHWMHARGAKVCGLEPVASNRDAALAAGIPGNCLSDTMDGFAARRFDLVLYLDSFEHLPDPKAHLRALSGVTAPGSRAMLVLPVAGSLSGRLLGRWWPHDIDDHWIFYSTAGLTALWASFGWHPVRQFNPVKHLTLQTIAAHLRIKTGRIKTGRIKTGLRLPLGPLARASVWLNFGERGLVFERQ